MPHVLRGLVLAGALALAGCGLGKVAQEQAKQQPVTAAQLAAMVVPRAELGDLAAGMRASATPASPEMRSPPTTHLTPGHRNVAPRRRAAHRAPARLRAR